MRIKKYGGTATNILEHSRGDLIPELNRIRNKMAILVVGHPGSGKSTFIKDHILRLNPNTKVFILEELSDRRKKMLNLGNEAYVSGTKRILLYAMGVFMDSSSKENFVYESTGNDMETVRKVHDQAKEKGYKTLIIQLSTSIIDTAQNRISRRVQSGGHGVDDSYLREVWAKNRNVTMEVKEMRPDSHYLITNDDNSRRALKLEDIEYGVSEAKQGVLGVFS